MPNTAKLIGVGVILLALVGIALLVFTEGDGGIGAPQQRDTGTGESSVPLDADLDAVRADKPERQRPANTGDADVDRETVADTTDTGSLLVNVLWPGGDAAPRVAVAFRTATRGLPTMIVARHVSDERGQIRVDGLPSGSLRLRSDRGGDLKVDVVAGRHEKCDFVLPEGIAVQGLVTDPHERPIADAEVWLQNEYNTWTAGRVIARTAADGTFTLRGIPAGKSLAAIAAGYSPSDLLDLDTVDTASPPVQVRLTLTDGGGGVAGRVVDAAGQPIAGATVAVGKNPSYMRRRGRDQWIEEWSQRTALTDQNGQFALAGIKTGTWPVAARAPDHGFWRNSVEVTAGETARVEITLLASATISGTVTGVDGAPLAKARVRAYDLAPKTPFIQGGQIDFDETFGFIAVLTDEQGRYRMSGVTPGTVHVYAQAARKPRSDDTVPFATTRLDVSPGAEVEWSPVIDPGRCIEGVVLFADGKPMPNVFVTAKDERDGVRHVLHAGSEGRFRFVCLEGASYSLHVQLWDPPKGTPPLERAGIVPGQADVEMRATFSKPIEGVSGEVRGRIDDAGGRIRNRKTLQIILLSDKRWWRTNVKIDGDAFTFADVEPGSYRVVALVGDTAIAQQDWFPVGEAETKDIGVLRTGPAGNLTIHLERSEETADLEPTFYLNRNGWSRGSKLELGRRAAATLENLSPGKYSVTAHAVGMARLEGEVHVNAGETAELRFTPKPAVLVRYEIWFPEGRTTGTATMKIVAADGSVFSEHDRTHGEVPPRPYKRSIRVPRGQWSIVVTTDTGLSGLTQFTIDGLSKDVDLRVDPK